MHLCRAGGGGDEIHEGYGLQTPILNSLSNGLTDGSEDTNNEPVVLSLDNLALKIDGSNDNPYTVIVYNINSEFSYGLIQDITVVSGWETYATNTIEFDKLSAGQIYTLVAKPLGDETPESDATIRLNFELPENFEPMDTKHVGYQFTYKSISIQVASDEQQYCLVGINDEIKDDYWEYTNSPNQMKFETINLDCNYMLYTRVPDGIRSNISIYVSAYNDVLSMADIEFSLNKDTASATFPVSANKCYAVVDFSGIPLSSEGDSTWIMPNESGNATVTGLTTGANYRIIVADKENINKIDLRFAIGAIMAVPNFTPSEENDSTEVDTPINPDEEQPSIPVGPPLIVPSSPIVVPVVPETPPQEPIIVPDSNGRVELTISNDDAEKLLKNASASIILIDSSKIEGKVLSVSIPITDLQNLLNEREKQGLNINDVSFILTHGQMSMTVDTLSLLCDSESKKLEISIKEISADSLSSEQQSIVDIRLVYEISITLDGQNIERLSGSIAVSLMYGLRENENPENLNIYFLGDAVNETTKCVYFDGKVIFNINRAASFAIMYGEEAPIVEETTNEKEDLTPYYILAAVVILAVIAAVILLWWWKKD